MRATSASGTALQGGMVRPGEFGSWLIPHALRLGVPEIAKSLIRSPAVRTDGRFAGAPTLDLTIHFRAPVASGEWVLADYRSRFSAGGVWEEDGELWAPDGTLLAQSRQLALIRA